MKLFLVRDRIFVSYLDHFNNNNNFLFIYYLNLNFSNSLGRGRENKENEKNLEDGLGGGYNRRGRPMNGPMRGRGGRGGGRLGPRTFQSQSGGGHRGGSGGGGRTFSRPIETWNSAEQEHTDSIKMGKFY